VHRSFVGLSLGSALPFQPLAKCGGEELWRVPKAGSAGRDSHGCDRGVYTRPEFLAGDNCRTKRRRSGAVPAKKTVPGSPDDQTLDQIGPHTSEGRHFSRVSTIITDSKGTAAITGATNHGEDIHSPLLRRTPNPALRGALHQSLQHIAGKSIRARVLCLLREQTSSTAEQKFCEC